MHYYPKDTGERADTDLKLAHLPRRAYGKDADLIKVSELPPGGGAGISHTCHDRVCGAPGCESASRRVGARARPARRV
jgi:hypothetical protein